MDTDAIDRTFLINVAAAGTSPAAASSAVGAIGTLGVTVLGAAISDCCGGMWTMNSRDGLEKVVLAVIMDGSTDDPLDGSTSQVPYLLWSGGV